MNISLTSSLFLETFRPVQTIFTSSSESVYECVDLRTDSPCLVSVRNIGYTEKQSYNSSDLSERKRTVFQHPMVGNFKDVILGHDASKIMTVSEAVVSPNRRSLNTFVRSSCLQDEQYQNIIWEVLKRFESLLSDLQKNNRDVSGLPPRGIGFKVKNGSIEYLKLARPYTIAASDRKSETPYKNFAAKPCNIDLAALAYFCFTKEKFINRCTNVDELDAALDALSDLKQRNYVRALVTGEKDVLAEDPAASECSSSDSFEKCDAEQVEDESNEDKVSSSAVDQLSKADGQSGKESTSTNDEREKAVNNAEGCDEVTHEQEICEEFDVPPEDDFYSLENLIGKFKTLTADDKDFRLCEIPNLDIACKLKLELDIPLRKFEYFHGLIKVYCNSYCSNIFRYEGNRITGISWGKKEVPDVLDECTRANLIMLAAAVEVATSQPCLQLTDAFGNDDLTITVHYNKRTNLARSCDMAAVVDNSMLEYSTMEKDFAEKMHRAAISVYEAMLYSGTISKNLHILNFK